MIHFYKRLGNIFFFPGLEPYFHMREMEHKMARVDESSNVSREP